MDSEKFKNILKTIGPGILFAGAAIGGSHLIQSTRAGANFGFTLIPIVILINLLKYPFFEYGHRYTATTGESLLHGYLKLGKAALIVFFIMNIFTAVVNGAAVTLVTAGLMANLFGFTFSLTHLSIFILILTLLILFVGHYRTLDKIMKLMIVLLAITTIITVIIAFNVDFSATTQQMVTESELWDAAGIAFLLALMGWMPAPIEGSVWPSLWALERSKETKYTPTLKEYLIDFHLGYVGTTIIAIFFVGLGALVMFGTGQQFSDSGVVFSSQLVSLYTQTIGNWSEVIIATIVFVTMASTTLTVFDAYPRTLAGSIALLSDNSSEKMEKYFIIIGAIMAVVSIVIINFFSASLTTLIDFATIMSFLAAPVFAFINYKVVTSDFMKKEMQPPKWLKSLSWLGIIFLVVFSLIYIGSLFAL